MTFIEEIYNLSKVGYSEKAISIVDVILDAKWSTIEKLENAYNWLNQQIEPSVISFFQLPFPVLLPNNEIELAFPGINIPNPLVNFELIGSELNTVSKDKIFAINYREKYLSEDRYVNASIKNEKIGVINRTQVTIKFKLWRFWKDYYDQYYNAYIVNSDAGRLIYKMPIGKIKRHLVDSAGVPITAGKFEYDLKKRIKSESLHIINKINKYYSVSCKHSIPYQLKYLNNFFVMIDGGRLSTLGPGESMITSEVDRLPVDQLNKNLKSLNKYLSSKREVSIYEQYILNAIDLIDNKSYNLAVVYVAMILEWFANEIIDDNFEKILLKNIDNKNLIDLCIDKMWRKSNKKNKEKVYNKLQNTERFTKYFPAIGIDMPQSLIGKVTNILEKRNSIVHGDQSKTIDRKYADKSVDDALFFIDYVMSQLLQKKCNNPTMKNS